MQLRSRAYPLLMESKAGSGFLSFRASFRKTASHFSGSTLVLDVDMHGLRTAGGLAMAVGDGDVEARRRAATAVMRE